MYVIELGVREFLDLTLKSGGLSADFMPRARAAAGIAAHGNVTANRPPAYQREVPCRISYDWKGYRLIVNGRIDGILAGDTHTSVEEIKSTYQPLSSLDAHRHPFYLAQLRLYHHYICQSRPGVSVVPQLTFVHPITHVERTFTLEWSAQSSAEFFHGLAQAFLEKELAKRRWHRTRDASIRELNFPFASPRQGQVALIGTVEQALHAHIDALVEAATGIGKTMGVLYPAIQHLGRRNGCARLFYLTAKSAGAEAARNAISALRAQGLRIRVLYLQAKDRCCPFPTDTRPECDEHYCPYADDFYTRVASLLPELLAEEELTAELIASAAHAHQLCPFELALELALEADIVVCDYNYAFDPAVYLRRFFSPNMPNAQLFLVDEAHNLVPRSREMYSAWLDEAIICRLMEEYGREREALHYCLQQVLNLFAGWRMTAELESLNGVHLDALPPALPSLLDGALEIMGDMLVNLPRGPRRQTLLDAYFALNRFARTAETMTQDYAVYVVADERLLRLRLLCLHPGPLLRQRLERSQSTIFFSATLSPSRYFRELLGAREGCLRLDLPCPFPREHRLYLHIPELSTRYVAREQTRPTVAQAIADVVRARRGNYLAFFPSYAYQGMVWAELQLLKPEGMRIFAQKPSMTLDQQGEFLLQVTTVEENRSHLGLAVMGGLFGEAVDMPGEQLIGAIIVGPGLPAVSMETELIREYFDVERHGEGFYYAFTVPGMIRVVQAAGRVFRAPQDRGVVVLMDDRFLQEPYRELLPPDWRADDPDFSQHHFRETLAVFWAEEDTHERVRR